MERERIVVRALKKADIRPIFQLRWSDDVAKFSVGPPPTWEDHTEYMRSFIERERFFLVAELDGHFAGYASVSPLTASVNIAVVPGRRKQGVASCLLAELQELHPKLQATVHSDNTASLALFHKMGFVDASDNKPWRLLRWKY